MTPQKRLNRATRQRHSRQRLRRSSSGGGGSSITASLVPSSSGGTAPYCIFFDASATTSTQTTYPFHEILYMWDFGETTGPGVGTWSTGAQAGVQSRNTDYGPMAAHVYETPGNYTVTLTIYDGVSLTTITTNVTIDDPDSVYSGTNTICVSSAGNFTGAPAGASQVTVGTANFDTAKAQVAAGKRVLFRRGETWTISTQAAFNFNNATGGQIGAFGTGANPVIQRTVGYTTGSNTINFSTNTTPNQANWTMYDFTIDHSLISIDSHYGVGFTGGNDQFLLLRVVGKATGRVFLTSAPVLDIWNQGGGSTQGHHIWDKLAIVDCATDSIPVGSSSPTSTWPYGMYLQGERVFLAGNNLDLNGISTAGTSHVIRLPYVAKAVIRHNTLAHQGPSEHIIKCHCDSTCGSFTASITGTVMTVTALDFPTGDPGYGKTLQVNHAVRGVGVTPGTWIVSLGTGTGGLGTYNVSASQTVASEAMQVVHAAEYDGIGAGTSRWISFGDNRCIGSYGSLMLAFRPQSSGTYEVVTDVIIEANWLSFDQVPNSSVSMMYLQTGPYLTVRNNLLDASNGNFITAINISQATADPAPIPSYAWAYNNSIYYGDSDNDFLGISLGTGVTNSVVKNNLCYSPNDSAHIAVTDSGTGNTVSNNSTTSQCGATDPKFSGALSAATGWRITDGTSYTKNAGANVPNWRDFFGNTRVNGSMDIGASEQ